MSARAVTTTAPGLGSPAPPAPAPAPTLLLVHGDERYLVDLAARDWLRAARAQFGVEVAVFDATSKFADVRLALTEVAMFEPQRALLWRDPPQLGGSRASKQVDGAEALVALLGERAPGTAVCLVVHGTVPASNTVLAAIAGLGGRVVQHPSQRPREVRDWFMARLRNAGLRLDRESINLALRVCGADLGRLDGEIAKLVAFSRGGGAVAFTDVEALLAGDEQVAVWAVLERLLGERGGGAYEALDGLLSAGASTQYLLATLAGQLRDLLTAQELLAEGQNQFALSRTMGLQDWRAERLVRQARRVPAAAVGAWLGELQRIDAGTKAGEIDDAEALRRFMLGALATVGAPVS